MDLEIYKKNLLEHKLIYLQPFYLFNSLLILTWNHFLTFVFCIGIFIAKFECLKRKLELVTLKLLKTDTVRRLNSEQRRGHNLAAQSEKKKKLTAKKRDWLSNCMLGKNTGMDVK